LKIARARNLPRNHATSYDHTQIWSKDTATGRIDVFAKENADLLTLVEWMDMGVQFVNTAVRK
jgi:hypothetical protein